MAGANDVACSDDPDPQLMIIFVHWLCAISVVQLHRLLCELRLTASNAEAFNQSLIGAD
jgi:hypothetical protein